jgi:hypothetical protein
MKELSPELQIKSALSIISHHQTSLSYCRNIIRQHQDKIKKHEKVISKFKETIKQAEADIKHKKAHPLQDTNIGLVTGQPFCAQSTK